MHRCHNRLGRLAAVFPACLLLTMLCGLVWPAMVWAQGGARAGDVETVTLSTKDGVRLGASYYPSSRGRDAVPVLMLHDYKESRAIFHNLALSLQNPDATSQNSHAVVTLDLRGHGDSRKREDGREIAAARLNTKDYRNMVLFDLEAVRKFLVKKNDAGELNLNKLCLLGGGLGANVATSWAAVDWSAPKLPRIKQGQDVKGLFLASPSWSAFGLPLLQPLRQPGVQRQVSLFMVYGAEQKKVTKSVKSIYKNLDKYRPRPPRGEMPDLIAWPLATELQGTKLLVDPQFEVLTHLRRFLDARLDAQDYPWQKRRPKG